jgi:antitoxin component YwqK of YwqJK toxin-antitoxin module
MKIERTVVIATLSVIVGLGIPVVTLGETMDDLVKRDGLYYRQFTDTPFTGKITEKKIQGTFRDGKRDGPWVYYHDNGPLRAKGTYKNGRRDGPWVTYHKNGQMAFKGTYKNSKLDGPWVKYSEKGRVLEQGEN